jgi:hypothetical protein
MPTQKPIAKSAARSTQKPIAKSAAKPTAQAAKPAPARIYLSGPMTGLPGNNFYAFNTYAATLRGMGLDIVNPAEIGGDANDTNPANYNAYLRADIKAMMDCDGIALMPGWETSTGANLELHIAHRVGMRVLFVDDLLAARRVAGLVGA